METFRRDRSRALSTIPVIALLYGLLSSAEVLRAQEVDAQGLYSQPFLVLDPDMHTGSIDSVASDSAGRYVITASSDKTVRVWSADRGKLLRTIRLPGGPHDVGQVHAVVVSPNGDTIAAAGWTIPGAFSIFLYERATGHQVGRIGPLPRNVMTMAISRDGRRIAATVGGQTATAWSLHLFDLERRTQIAVDDTYTAPIYGVSFDGTGRIATASDDGKIRLYDANLRQQLVANAPGSKFVRSIAFSPDNSRIVIESHDGDTGSAVKDRGRLDVVDARTLKALFQPNINRRTGVFHDVTWSADGNILYAGGASEEAGRSVLFVWQSGGRGSLQVFPISGNSIQRILEIPGGRVVVASADPALSLLDRAGSMLWQVTAPNADLRDQQKFGVSSDGKRVRFRFNFISTSVSVFDIGKRSLDLDAGPDDGFLIAKTEGLPITAWRASTQPQIGGRSLAIDQAEVARSLAIARDARSFWLGSEWSLRHFDATGALIRRLAVPGIPWAINLTADDRLLVTAQSDGTIRWYRTADGAELLAFYPHADGKRWIAWTPLGHYAASPGAEDFIQWQINRGLDQEPVTYSASRFRDQFYRPDVVERVLETLDPKRALEAADDAAGLRRTVVKSIAEYTPPRVAIVDPAEATFVERPELVVAYTIEDRPGTVIRRIRLMLDGSVVAEEKNRKISTDGRMTGEFKVSLQGEQSLITLLAENEYGASDPSSVRIRRNATTDAHKPTLYVLAIGVGKFKNHAHLKLNFADADATAFVERLRQQERGLYRRVEVVSLVNDQATAEAILKGLEWLERNMGARDVAAVFFSSHGANDAARELYLLPHDVNVQDDITLRRTGVRYSDLRATLIRLAERGKTLLFLDACHSGNVLSNTKAGPPDLDKVAADLASAENGVVVFSSSTGKQFSIEYPSLGHGAFTAALLEAFDGKSDRPPPWLRVSDLEIWIAARVKALTNGAQTPTTTIPGERFINPRVFMVQQPPG